MSFLWLPYLKPALELAEKIKYFQEKLVLIESKSIKVSPYYPSTSITNHYVYWPRVKFDDVIIEPVCPENLLAITGQILV